MEQPRSLDTAGDDSAGADFSALSPSSSTMESGGATDPIEEANGAVVMIASEEMTTNTGGEAPMAASRKRAREEERTGDKGGAQGQEALETAPLPSPESINAMTGEADPEQSSAAPGPTETGTTPDLVDEMTAPYAKRPRRRKAAAATLAPASMNHTASFPPVQPTPNDLPRADEILGALERQAALLERQTRVQEEQNRVIQQLLEFLSRPSRPAALGMTMPLPPTGPTQM